MWLLGRHRLLCGDSTVATDVKRVSPISRRGRARRRGWIHSGPPKWRMAQENHRDAQISDTGLDDLKDFAPHRLDLPIQAQSAAVMAFRARTGFPIRAR